MLDSWSFDKDDAYVHFCQNETVHGVEYLDSIKIAAVPLVCDMSSTILSRPVNVLMIMEWSMLERKKILALLD